jgi:hypothetical protein
VTIRDFSRNSGLGIPAPMAALGLAHFQKKACPGPDPARHPIFRPKMSQRKNASAVSVSRPCETALR